MPDLLARCKWCMGARVCWCCQGETTVAKGRDCPECHDGRCPRCEGTGNEPEPGMAA